MENKSNPELEMKCMKYQRDFETDLVSQAKKKALRSTRLNYLSTFKNFME